MRTLVFAEAELPDAYRAQVDQLVDEAWPRQEAVAGSGNHLTHDPALEPQIMLLVDAGQVVATLATLRKELRHRNEIFKAAGLSAVTTRATVRGRGYGHRLVAEARRRLGASDADLGIFSCDLTQQAFYERAGWQSLPGTVIFGGTPAAPFRSDQPGFAKVTMAAFFSAHARTHRRSFAHSDIELYPGEIDRLW